MKSNPVLKQFDEVAHVISVPEDTYIQNDGERYQVLKLYINKYGFEVGALVRNSEGDIMSWGYQIWEEYLEQVDRPVEQGNT